MSYIRGKSKLVACAAAALFLPAHVGAFVAPAVTPARRRIALMDLPEGTSFRPSGASPEATTPEAAKKNLREALAVNRGSTLAADVIAAAEELARFNPPSSTARASWPIHSGDWVSIGEDFVGATRTADGVECTLGRLVFNIFEPVNLPVLITEIHNIIGPRPEGAEPTDLSVYENHIRWVARNGSGLKGRVEVEGVCWEDPSKPERVLVRFTKGSIQPDEAQDLDAWRKVIGVADVTQEKGPLSRLKEGAARLLLKVAFGFKGPADSQGPGGELSYEMKRSPKGSLDILYLDDEMRVTRGNRGALTIVSRS